MDCNIPDTSSIMTNNNLEIPEKTNKKSSSSSSKNNDSCIVQVTTTTPTQTKLNMENIEKKRINCNNDLDYVVDRESLKYDRMINSKQVIVESLNKKLQEPSVKHNQAKDNEFKIIDEGTIQDFFLRKIKNYVNKCTEYIEKLC